MTFIERQATESDSDFLYELKKSAEYDAIEAVFGWDECVQRRLHRSELKQAFPTIVQIGEGAIGSYLFQEFSDHFYLGRFFLLPQFQGKGLGGNILAKVVLEADTECKPIRLCYLQGNRVERLYQRFGFKRLKENLQFVYMERPPICL